MKRKTFKALAIVLSLSCMPVMGAPAIVNAAEASVESIVTDQDTIKLVQALLNCMGYDCGTPDGIAGNKKCNNGLSETEGERCYRKCYNGSAY